MKPPERIDSGSFDYLAAGFGRVLDRVVGVLFLSVIAITLVEVGGRYLFAHSFVWSDEAMRLLHIWMILLAAVRASHMRIELMLDRLPARIRHRLDVVTRITSLVILGVLVYGAWLMMELTARDLYTGLKVPVSLAFLALAVSGTLWGLRLATSVTTTRDR